MLKKSDDKSCRAHYLRKIKKFRSEGRNIIFLDETWIFLGHGQRLIIVHAGSRKGFVTGALLFFISKKTGDDRQDMDGKAFEKWFEETLLPLLEENSVVVMDNAPYHSVQADNVPQRNWSKGEMQKWLRQNSVHFDIQMIKSKLWSLIKDIKSRFQKFKVDEIALKAGHEVLRLPPRHCILNPIEMAWSQVKDFVTKKMRQLN
uniref:Tc1-like transposase DDE domain-containing protein n=1 Tax=Strigamia maritima TaxID=126957 RepID=T1IL83_STRMM